MVYTIKDTISDKYPLYTAELAGKAYDKVNGVEYEMVIITQWTNRTEKAKEVCHKAYYFEPDRNYLYKNIKNEEWCANIFASFKEHSKIMIER